MTQLQRFFCLSYCQFFFLLTQNYGPRRKPLVLKRHTWSNIFRIPGEESLCTVTDVPCFEENVMEYVGEREGLVGAGNPRFEGGVQFGERRNVSRV